MKLSPANENAAASEFEVLEVVVGESGGDAVLGKLVEDALFCFLVTDI